MRSIKTTLSIVIASFMGLAAMAQKTNSAHIPLAVKNAFTTAYPAVKTVKWEKEKGDFEAGFMQGSNKMSAVFKADGSQVESEMEIKPDALPAAVIVYVKRHYKSATIKEAAKITNSASGEIMYEAEVKGTDLLFDSVGKFKKIARD